MNNNMFMSKFQISLIYFWPSGVPAMPSGVAGRTKWPPLMQFILLVSFPLTRLVFSINFARTSNSQKYYNSDTYVIKSCTQVDRGQVTKSRDGCADMGSKDPYRREKIVVDLFDTKKDN